MGTIARKALAVVLPRFALAPTSNIHGVPHWARVARNGRQLAKALGVNPDVTEWFAYLHDSCRLNDNGDHQHGLRAAEFAGTLREVIDLELTDFRKLLTALDGHSYGYQRGFDKTILACWDADRLDLLRVNVQPDPLRMCTKPGASMARDLPRLREIHQANRVRPRGKSVYNLITSLTNELD